MERSCLVFVALVLLIAVLHTPGTACQSGSTISLEERLTAVDNFLLRQFDADAGLVRESPDDSINQTYWLLSDNLLAYHALKPFHPDIAMKIEASLQRFGILQDGLHEALFGGVIEVPPYTPQEIILAKNESWSVKAELRSSKSGKLMNDWTEYADLLIYASLSEHNRGNDLMASYYFKRAQEMWNGAGLYDKPTQQDGFYTTHKLALLLYASRILNQTLPFRTELETRIWMFQRGDGGIRSHFLGNLTSDREANAETASMVLIAYNYGFEEVSKLLFNDLRPIYETMNETYFRENEFWSPAARSLFTESRHAYYSAVRNFYERDFESALVQGQYAILKLGEAESLESSFRHTVIMSLIFGTFAAGIGFLIFHVAKKYRPKSWERDGESYSHA